MNRSHFERLDELGEIVRVGRSIVLLPIVLPCADPMISLGIGDEPISLCDLLSDRLPYAKIGNYSMAEDDGFAGALFDINRRTPLTSISLANGPDIALDLLSPDPGSSSIFWGCATISPDLVCIMAAAS